MKQKNKKLLSIILALCIALSCVVGMSATAFAEETDTSTYSLVIPSTLNVQNSGWNAVGEISATGTLAQGKKLTVSAESANSFALVSGENSVAYTMKSAEADTAATTAWEFTELPGSAAFGIDVSDYSTKPAGTYQDTVTFTAKVEDAKPEYYNKLTKINDNFKDQVYKLKVLGRGRESYNSSLTAAQAWKLAKYQAAIDNVTVYVIMSSQDDGYEIHYAVSTDAAATEHTIQLYELCNESNPVRMYYIAQ